MGQQLRARVKRVRRARRNKQKKLAIKVATKAKKPAAKT